MQFCSEIFFLCLHLNFSLLSGGVVPLLLIPRMIAVLLYLSVSCCWKMFERESVLYSMVTYRSSKKTNNNRLTNLQVFPSLFVFPYIKSMNDLELVNLLLLICSTFFRFYQYYKKTLRTWNFEDWYITYRYILANFSFCGKIPWMDEMNFWWSKISYSVYVCTQLSKCKNYWTSFKFLWLSFIKQTRREY